MKTLVVDRVKLFKNIIKEILRDTDIDHVFAKTGEEALEILKHDKFECICMSLHLDDMSGIELCQKIRHLPEFMFTPIVLLSSDTSPKLMSEAMSSGITDIFSKNRIHELVNFIERFSKINQHIEGRILYVEDQKSQRDFLTALFKSRGLEVDAFATAEEAWEAFLANRYHLVVTDIVLEGNVSGVVFINKIRRLDGSKGDIPILAITAFDNSSRRISLFHMGITDYVTKPIIQEELIARIKNLISNQRALEREMQFREQLSSEETLRTTMKMDALGKLTGGVAHDYNNMLGVILGYSELLERKLDDQPTLKKYASQITTAGQRGASLTNKLLSFSRGKVSDAVQVNINDLIRNSLQLLDKTLTANISLETSLDEGMWRTLLDPNDFEDALLNICINAKHAMNDQGKLSIETTRKNLELSESEALGIPPGEYIRLSISDSGHGMDQETRERIFDPFYSTKGDAGTGLGLSQVYGFVQRSGGTIQVHSQEGVGTTFSLYFPRNDDVIAEADDAGKENFIPEIEAKTILVVDDEPALCELTSELLNDYGHTTFTATSADEALDIIRNNPVDLLITDIIMPNKSGYDLASDALIIRPDIKLIFASGYDSSDSKAGFKTEIKYGYLQKPVNPEELAKVVAEAFT